MFCVYETESEHESSTEAELVGVDDILSKMLWTKLFIEAHGHKVNMNVIYCDNTRGGRVHCQETQGMQCILLRRRYKQPIRS